MKVDDKVITHVAGLIDLIEKSKGEPIELTIFRAGKQKTIEVTPKPRPADQAATLRYTLPKELPLEIRERLDRWMKSRDKGVQDRDFGMWFMRPGMMMPKDFMEQFEFPKNWKLSISREGDGPVHLRVEADGKTWEATDKDLEQLPEKIRPWIERALRGYWSWQGWTDNPRTRVFVRPKSDAADEDDKTADAPKIKRFNLRDAQQRPTDWLKQLEEFRRLMEALNEPSDKDNVLEELREEMKKLRREVEELRKEKRSEFRRPN